VAVPQTRLKTMLTPSEDGKKQAVALQMGCALLRRRRRARCVIAVPMAACTLPSTLRGGELAGGQGACSAAALMWGSPRLLPGAPQSNPEQTASLAGLLGRASSCLEVLWWCATVTHQEELFERSGCRFVTLFPRALTDRE